MVPVEERLRSTLVDLAYQVRVDAERPLEDVRRRRKRRVNTLWAGAGAAVVALVAAAVTLMPQPTHRPEPTNPPAGERTDAPQRTIPLTTYTRRVTDDEVLDAGFPRGAVADLFGEAGRARVELVFRTRPNRNSEPPEDWALWFVDAQGERRIGDRGYYLYGHDGELILVSLWSIDCMNCNYVLSWELEAGSLVFEPTPKKPTRPTTALLGDGTWERQGR